MNERTSWKLYMVAQLRPRHRENGTSCEKCHMVSSMLQFAPHLPWQYPSSSWDRVHIVYGEYKGTHLVNAYCKWPEVWEMSTTMTQQTLEVLQEIFEMHGFPMILVSDNGPQFSSAELKAFLARNHIVHCTSAPCHPATNAVVMWDDGWGDSGCSVDVG